MSHDKASKAGVSRVVDYHTICVGHLFFDYNGYVKKYTSVDSYVDLKEDSMTMTWVCYPINILAGVIREFA